MRLIFAMVAVIGVMASGGANGQEVSLEAAPAVVVKSVPEAGAKDVDAGMKEIRVTFSKEMAGGSWSWATYTKESSLEIVGEPRYLEDKRTCVLPVKLVPGRTYAIWVNSPVYKNFKDERGGSSLPYLLVFRTKG